MAWRDGDEECDVKGVNFVFERVHLAPHILDDPCSGGSGEVPRNASEAGVFMKLG